MRRTLFVASLALGACDGVGVDPVEPSTGLVTGSLLIQTSTTTSPCTEPPGGNVILSVFDATNPPPPSGAGASVIFSVVPEARWLVGNGPIFATDYALPFLPDGTFLVSGFVDADGDFSPNAPLSSQPTAGDLAGGFVDAAQSLVPVAVERAEEQAGILVQLGRAVPVEPPAFRFQSATIDAPTTASSTLTLDIAPQSRGPFQHRAVCSGFLVQVVDANADGVPDDANGDGQPDLLPLVTLTQLEAEQPVRVVATIDPTNVADELFTRGFAVTPILNLQVPPQALRPGEDGTLEPAGAPPPGPYAVSVFTGTSQRWTVPNEVDLVDPEGAPSAQSVPLVLR